MPELCTAFLSVTNEYRQKYRIPILIAQCFNSQRLLLRLSPSTKQREAIIPEHPEDKTLPEIRHNYGCYSIISAKKSVTV